MRDFRVRQWAGGATAFLAVIGTGKMPVPRLVPWRACKVGAREFPCMPGAVSALDPLSA